MSHADVARDLTNRLPPGVFARACLPAVQSQDFVQLEAMLPGVKFAVTPLARDMWDLTGVCKDGSIVHWGVGDGRTS